MVSITKQEIQNTVAEYLAERIKLGDLQDWLAPHAWAINDDTDQLVSGLIYSVELKIYEYDAGHLPRDAFVSELKELACGAHEFTSASSNTMIEMGDEISPFELACSLSSGEFSLRLVGSI